MKYLSFSCFLFLVFLPPKSFFYLMMNKPFLVYIEEKNVFSFPNWNSSARVCDAILIVALLIRLQRAFFFYSIQFSCFDKTKLILHRRHKSKTLPCYLISLLFSSFSPIFRVLSRLTIWKLFREFNIVLYYNGSELFIYLPLDRFYWAHAIRKRKYTWINQSFRFCSCAVNIVAFLHEQMFWVFYYYI